MTRRRPLQRLAGDAIGWVWPRVQRAGTVRDSSRVARRFAHFGAEATIAFPQTVLHSVERIELGAKTSVGPHATLSVGMPVPVDQGSSTVLTIGQRCVLGRGLTILAHERIEIGDDTFAGNYVFIADQNHGYEQLDTPIGRQWWRNAPVKIGEGCWLGHGSIILPGSTIGRHVVVAAGAVVTGEVPDYCVVAGVPARIIRRHVEGQGWVATDAEGSPLT